MMLEAQTAPAAFTLFQVPPAAASHGMRVGVLDLVQLEEEIRCHDAEISNRWEFRGIGGTYMPLKRAEGQVTSTGSSLEFPMLSLKGEKLRCFVDTTALKEVARNNSPIDPWSIFHDRRALLESIASQKYDCGDVDDGLVVVGLQDMRNAGL